MTSPSDYDNSFIAEALPAFISEAEEQIASIEQLLLQLEDAPGDRELLAALFRCAHTVKGSAGIFGLDAVVAFTHHVETLLDRLREGAVALTPDISTLLLRCNDQIRQLLALASVGSASDDGVATREQLVAQLAAISDTATGSGAAGDAPAAAIPTVATPGAGGWHIAVRFGPDIFRNGMDPLAILSYLGQLGTVSALRCDHEAVPLLEALDPESCHLALTFELQGTADRAAIENAFSFVRDDVTLELSPLTATTLAAAPPPPPSNAAAAAAIDTSSAAESRGSDAGAQGATKPRDGGSLAVGDANRYIRVQADRLDAVINLLGELVIAGAGAALLARQTRNATLIEANEQIGTLIEEIRNGTLQLRMVPIGETFARFRRVVRDTAAELGKDVALDIVGGETELDKSVVERIADPLMHLVRNALDHGLEMPADRTAAGKSPEGRLTLAACHESGSILIRISDDGRGIQRQKVLERAWDRGLVERGVTPSDAEIDKLIFEPGFSTAEKVTNLSGRGVGMDVVRRNIEALRGSVAIHSQPGHGSTIEIRLPLTLAIIDGFLVGVGPSKFILPLDAVVEVIESRADGNVDPRGRGCVELRGQVLPVVSLRALYGLDSPEPDRSSVVVLQAGGQRYGVRVDHLLGQHQTVIKPLGRMFRSLRGMAGSSILGNGEVALIFDASALGELAAQPPPITVHETAPRNLITPARGKAAASERQVP